MNQLVVSQNSTVPVSVESVIDFDVMTEGKKCNLQKVNKYVDRIQNAYGKTVDAMLDLASTVYEANKNLNDKEWRLVQDAFKWKSDITKLLAIGKQYSVLLPYKNSLPSARQSLFLIAQYEFKSEQLAKYVASGEINRYSTTQQLNEIFNEGGKPSSVKKELITIKKVDPSANLVCLIVNTTKEGEEEIRRHPNRVQTALKLIERGMRELKDLGFQFTENTIKFVEDLKKGENKVAA